MSYYPRPFQAGPIEPIVDPGQFLLLVDREGYNLYQVAFIEPLPESRALEVAITLTGNTLAVGGTSPVFNTQAVLDMQDNQLGQYRMKVLDPVDVAVNQPNSVARYGNRNISSLLSWFTSLGDRCSHTTETYILAQDRIFLTAVNNTGRALTLARVAFWGFKYVLVGSSGVPTTGSTDPIETFKTMADAVRSGRKFTVVPAGGWGR